MDETLSQLRKLCVEQRSRDFFNKPLYSVTAAFRDLVKEPTTTSTFRKFCDIYIYWGQWESACYAYKVQSLKDLPKKVAMYQSTADEEALMKVTLKVLLYPSKSSKTFKDFM